MAPQLDKNPISTPPSSVKGDAYWHARTTELDAFLLETQTSPPEIQRATLKEILGDISQELRDAPPEDRLKYQTMLRTVRQELQDLNRTHPETKTDKTIRLTTEFATVAANTGMAITQSAYQIAKPIVIKGAKIAWAGVAWTGTKLWDIARGEGEKIIDDISYKIDAIKSDIRNNINNTKDEVAYMYHKAEPKIFAVGGMATFAGAGLLAWNLTHTNPDAVPEGRVQLALNDQPETMQTVLREEWNPKIEGLTTPQKETPQHTKKQTRKKQKKTEIDLETITVAANLAAERGLSPQYAATVALIESSGNPYAHNPSGAKGVYQFIPSTAANYGLKKPFDAVANTKAFIRFTKDNEDILVDYLGREPSDAEKYLAHQQGAAGAAKLLTNPNTKAAELVGTQAIVQNGGHSKMTAKAFVSMWKEKYAQKEAFLEIREVK